MLYALFLLTLCLAWVCPSEAQFRSVVWTAENGLPQNIIRGIAQTPDGYLWIATLDGLARFDGVQFRIFDKSNSPGMVSNRFGGMLGTPDGDLWLIVVEGKGVTRYHHGQFFTYDFEVFGATQDGQGHLWILTRNSILMWSASSQNFVPVQPLEGNKIQTLRWEDGGFWTIKQTTLSCFFHGRNLAFPLPPQVTMDNIHGVAVAEDETAWLELNDERLFHLTSSKIVPIKSKAEAHASFETAENRWTYRIGKRLDRVLEFTVGGKTEEIDLRRYYQDREHNLWIGTEGSGLIQLQHQTITTLSLQQGLPGQVVYPILQDHDDALWLGVWGVGVSRLLHGQVTTFTPHEGLHDPLVTAIAEDRDHQIWIGTHGSIALLKGSKFEQPFQIPLPGAYIVQVIYQDTQGTLWVGTSRGLVAKRDHDLRIYTVEDGLATSDIRAIAEAPDHSLWIAGYGGLTHLKDGRFTRWTEKEGLPSNNIRSLYLDHDETLWIGTYDGGIGRMKDGRIARITMRDGLFSNGAFQILEDARQNFWISSNRGIYRLSRRELNEFADGRVHTVSSVSYGKADGMANVECNGGAAPAGIRTRDGRLLFPTQDGVAIVNPALVSSNPTPPPVEIESYAIDQVTTNLNGKIVVPPAAQNLDLQYTALSLINSSRIRFRYRLEGFDSDWVDAGTRRSAYYSHLPPGKFRFHVIAANSDGVWSSQGRFVDVQVLAPFYRTPWFLLLGTGALLASLLYVWNLRIISLQRRQQMQQAFAHQLIASQEVERQRIAAELHDGIVQRFVAIKNLGHIYLRSTMEAPSLIEQVTEQAAAGIEETREISYNLRPVQLDRLGLTRAIAGVLRTAAEGSSLQVHSTLDDIDDALPEDLRINFYRIVQESLNNILKHAHASEVHFAVLRTSRHILLTIQDNGRGFPASGSSTGFGLIGMSERTQLLGGTLNYQSGSSGTTLTVHIPLAQETSHV